MPVDQTLCKPLNRATFHPDALCALVLVSTWTLLEQTSKHLSILLFSQYSYMSKWPPLRRVLGDCYSMYLLLCCTVLPLGDLPYPMVSEL